MCIPMEQFTRLTEIWLRDFFIGGFEMKQFMKEFKEFKRKRNEKYFKQDRLDMD